MLCKNKVLHLYQRKELIITTKHLQIMKAKRLTANQAKNLVSNTKFIYRLCGFETGLRTNLQRAIAECRVDYIELGKDVDNALVYIESVYEKEYQNEIKVHFDNNGNGYGICFESAKCYLFEMYETKYLIVSDLGFCNVYRLIEKTESEKVEDQPAITYNGDSKKAVLDYNGKKIELTCTLSNTKVCKWDNKYPELHSHYVVRFKYGKDSGKFDFFDSLHNFKTGQTDKTEIDIFEMFYMFLSDCQMAIDYSFEECQEEFEGTKENYNACKRALQKFERVFAGIGIDLYDFMNYMQEKYNF